MKVKIGSRVPPRTSMFESRDGMGGYHHTFPPMSKDSELIQAGLLDLRKEYEAEQRKRGWVIPAYKIVVTVVLIGVTLYLLYELGR